MVDDNIGVDSEFRNIVPAEEKETRPTRQPTPDSGGSFFDHARQFPNSEPSAEDGPLAADDPAPKRLSHLPFPGLPWFKDQP